MTAITPEQQRALDIARELARLGMPLFLAAPDPNHWSGTGYALPVAWQRTEADPSVVDHWRPGMALCAVTGHVLDLIDVDPRSGGHDRAEIPQRYGVAHTPSGGTHYFVAPLNVPSRDGVYPGVDVKSGTEEERGRGFAFLAPTVRASKVDGIAREYRWVQPPYWGDGISSDRTGAALRQRIAELRAARPLAEQPRRLPMSVARNEWDRAYAKLVTDLRHWAATGWGGEAHAGLLSATTHLARLSPDNALDAYLAAFTAAGLAPDDQDLAKLHSAVNAAVPDVVVPDDQVPIQERFWAGAAIPEAQGADVPGPRDAGPGDRAQAGYVFAPVTRERFRNRTPPARPSVGTFGGAYGLFYPEGVHWLQGESESGKTWVALAVVAEALGHGQDVLFVDYEHTEDAILERLEALGVTDEGIERLVLVSGNDVLFTELVAHVVASGYALMVIDGVTSALSAAGLSGREEQETTRWVDLLPRRARMAICIDHVVKAQDERRGMAVGTQAKKNVVTGTAWEVVCSVPFGRGKSGRIHMNLQKDKGGWLRGQAVSRVKLSVRADGITGSVRLTADQVTDGERQAYRDAAKAAEQEALADRMYEWLRGTFNPGTSWRQVLGKAHGTAAERRMAGADTGQPRNCGVHNGWPRDLLNDVWRVWTAVNDGPHAATPDDQRQRDWFARWTGSVPTGVRDLEKPSGHSETPGHTLNGSHVDVDWVNTMPATQFSQSPVDLGL